MQGLCTELHDCIQHVQEPKALKEAVKKMYQRHVTETVASRSMESDIAAEYSRQRECAAAYAAPQFACGGHCVALGKVTHWPTSSCSTLDQPWRWARPAGEALAHVLQQLWLPMATHGYPWAPMAEQARREALTAPTARPLGPF